MLGIATLLENDLVGEQNVEEADACSKARECMELAAATGESPRRG